MNTLPVNNMTKELELSSLIAFDIYNELRRRKLFLPLVPSCWHCDEETSATVAS